MANSQSRYRSKKRHQPKTAIMAAIAVTSLASLVGVIYAANLSLPDSNLSAGTDDVSFCASGTNIQYGLRLTAAGATVVDSIRITGIPVACSGQFIALQIYNSSGTLLDEVVWQLVARAGDTSITAIADESTTSTSNASVSSASLSYPTSQTDPEGLATAITASQISRVEVVQLPANRAAQE